MSTKPRTASDFAEEYCFVVDQIHGMYLDASMGMGELARGYMQYDADRLQQLREAGQQLTPEIFNPGLVYSGTVRGMLAELHSTSLHHLINRNAPGGANWIFLANMCVVSMYQYWDDHYRKRIAEALGKALNELTHDTFGELRHLRRSIIHNRGRAVPEAANAKILKPFEASELVMLEPQDLHDLADSSRARRALWCTPTLRVLLPTHDREGRTTYVTCEAQLDTDQLSKARPLCGGDAKSQTYPLPA